MQAFTHQQTWRVESAVAEAGRKERKMPTRVLVELRLLPSAAGSTDVRIDSMRSNRGVDMLQRLKACSLSVGLRKLPIMTYEHDELQKCINNSRTAASLRAAMLFGRAQCLYVYTSWAKLELPNYALHKTAM